MKRFIVAALLLAGCSTAEPRRAGLSGALRVCAAASLRGAFEAILSDFGKAHPDVTTSLNSAGSQALRAQIEAGAPCDVIATADETTMEALARGDRVGEPRRFASNALVILVPASNPAAVATWRDLAKAPRIALAAPEVPVGKYARRFLANADAQVPGYAAAVTERTKTLELDVAHVVVRVRQGEVDAGITYRTDKTDGTLAVAIPEDLDVAADYPIAVVRATSNRAAAEAFVAAVLGPGQATLATRGFGAPRPTPLAGPADK